MRKLTIVFLFVADNSHYVFCCKYSFASLMIGWFLTLKAMSQNIKYLL